MAQEVNRSIRDGQARTGGRYDTTGLEYRMFGAVYWHLKGSFYPTQMPTKEWFAHYANHFSTVEPSTPFYS